MRRTLPTAVDRPLTRIKGNAAWKAGERMLTGCPATLPHRGWWLEGYLGAVRVSTFGSRLNSFVTFPVEPPRSDAIWTPVERDAVRIGRELRLPIAVLARLLGRSNMAVKVEACRMGKRGGGQPERVAA